MPYSIKDFPIPTNNFPLSDSYSQSQQRTQSSNFSRIRHPFKPLKNDARLSLSFILNSLVDSPPIRIPALFLVESECVKIQLQTSEGLYFGDSLHLKKEGRGVFHYKNGDMFKGIFKDDQIFDGVYTCRNGLTYTGQFENGRLIQGTTYKKINDSTRRHSSIQNYTISGKNCLSKIPKPKKIASDNSTVSSKQIVFKNYIPSQTNNP